MPKQVLMIGYGAIASAVAERLEGDDAVEIRWVLARPGREDVARKAVRGRAEPIVSLNELGDHVPDFAVECAGHAALSEHGPEILGRGIDLGIVSIGALADAGLAAKLERAAHEAGASIDLLSGAIGAIDAIASAREGGLDRVRYISRKPPESWRGTPAEQAADLTALAGELIHFDGTARDAARNYPKNANVAATLALAGLGLDKTRVQLIADPEAGGNVHEIEAEGAFGTLHFRIRGNPLPDNPKSSALTAMSVLRFIRNRARPVRI